MSIAIAHYGRLGAHAEGNPKVAELLKRTVEGQHRATIDFKAALEALKTQGLVPWTGPVGDLTLLLNLWVTLLAWERATVFLDAAVATDLDLGDETYRQTSKVCDEATAFSMQSIRMQAEASQGRRPGNASLLALPLYAGNASNTPLVWASLEAVYTRVRADLTFLAKLGIPPRMGKVYRALTHEYQSSAGQFDYLATQWYGTSTAENRVQLVRQAIPLAQQLYIVGQQLWAPYLAGPVYTDIVRSMPLFAKLGLTFDPWILTAPAEVEARVTDRDSCQQLVAFWQTVADPLAAKALQDDISEAIESESITIKAIAFKIAPWPAQYSVLHAVSVAQQQLEAGTSFTLYPRTIEGKRTLEIRITGHA